MRRTYSAREIWKSPSSRLSKISGHRNVSPLKAAAAPLSGTSDGVVRGDLRWSGREGAPPLLYLQWVELVNTKRVSGFVSFS